MEEYCASKWRFSLRIINRQARGNYTSCFHCSGVFHLDAIIQSLHSIRQKSVENENIIPDLRKQAPLSYVVLKRIPLNKGFSKRVDLCTQH